MITTAEIRPEVMPDRIVVTTDFRLKDRVKAVPGARWSAPLHTWSTPLSWPACLALRAEFGADLEIGPSLRDWAKATGADKKILRSYRELLEPPDVMIDPYLSRPGFADLHPYQLTGALAASRAGGYLILDETGTGKSRTGMAALSIVGKFPALVVCPKSMIPTWKTEALGFFPEADVRMVMGTPTKQKKALEPGGDIYIVNYENLKKHSSVAGWGSITLKDAEKEPGPLNDLGFKSVIADEVHYAKSPKAIATRALWAAAKGCEFRIGMTGTPIQDTPEDMWAPLYFVAPDEYPTKTSFIERYCQFDWSMWGGREITGLNLDHRDEFLSNFEARTRRITKDIAAPWLPKKVYAIRWVDLSSPLRKAYDEMSKTLVTELESGELAADSVLERALRLTQMANSSLEITPSGDPDKKDTVRMVAPSPKLDAFMADLKADDFGGSQIVIFSESRQLIELADAAMTKAKIEFVRITGAEDSEQREEAKRRFQAGEVKYILITRAGGTGITLTAADTMVRLVRSWSRTIHDQAEDRVHRIGSEIHDVITIIDYITTDTVEEGQLVRLAGKKERAQEVLRDDELLETMLTKIPETGVIHDGTHAESS